MSVTPQEPVLHRNDKVGVAVCVGVGVVAIFGVCESVVLWRHLGRAEGYAAGEPGVTLEQLAEGVKALTTFDAISRVGLLASGITLMIWLWAARKNAEALCRAGHRLGRGWVIGGWVCPVVSLWFPCQILDDVWRTSNPHTPADTLDVSVLPHSRPVRAWWLTWLASNFSATAFALMDSQSLPQIRTAAYVYTLSTLTQAVAAALLILIVHTVTGWQRTRTVTAPPPPSWPPGPAHPPPTPVGP
jgi:hypothetical protein